ncbi:MAG: carbon starvation protein A [Fidelibacterota bacterium]
MNSIVLALAGFTVFALGYRFYSRFIARSVYGQDDFSGPMPSQEFEDGIDYVPTQKGILFGHHFTSIAGAAPIIGPCVAAYWGWLPAFLWVVIGSVLIGAVHDYGALIVSVREKGRSIADITKTVITSRARFMFLIFVMMLIWLVLAVFAMAIADLFVAVPTSVLPINIQIVVAVIIGVLIYKKGVKALIPSLVALAILYLFVWIGAATPLSFESLGMSRSTATSTWIILLFVYSAIASLLPVWLLLQPRDYINSHQLIVGLGLLYLGLFVARPMIEAPMIRMAAEPGAPSLFPLLFVTIACGAISGFHGLVSSGTTSKQLRQMSDARLIGYGGMLGEGTLALAATLAAVAGISLVGACQLPAVGSVANLSWQVYYDSWAHASANKATAFVLGGGALIEQLGFSPTIARTLMAVLVIAFAATTLDTATRIQRFIITEIGQGIHFKLLTNRYMATILAVVPAVLLVFTNATDPLTGQVRQAGWILWPIFGASNQMLAALILMVLTIYFWQRKKQIIPLLIPMLFIMTVTLTALVLNMSVFWERNPLLFGIAVVLFLLIIWMMVEGVLAVRRKQPTGIGA